MRPTQMLTSEELCEDLGISKNKMFDLIEVGILKPIYMGKGWKFPQQQILDFQKDYEGLHVSNYQDMEKAYKIVCEQKEKATAGTVAI